MSIQEENTRQLRRLVKEQAETISILRKGIINHQGVVQSFTDSLIKSNETISKLKVLVRESFHDGYEWHDGYEPDSWEDSETKQDLERL